MQQGKHCLHQVQVLNIKDKCLDLKKALSQQTTQLGFLPITNLKRLSMASSLKPNRVLAEKDFDPVKIHEEVKATDNYNFLQAKIQLPSKLNHDLIEKLY